MDVELTLWQWAEQTAVGHWLLNNLWGQLVFGLVVLLLVSAIAGMVVSRLLMGLVTRMLRAVGRSAWVEALQRHKVAKRLGYAVPLILVMGNFHLLPVDPVLGRVISRLFLVLGLVYLFRAVNGVLASWQDVDAKSLRGQTRSIKGYLELAKIIGWAVCAVLAISILIDRSPLLMLSGIGALSAVLLLVFKDTLLSVVASTQMTANDMLRIGDWIEMPQAGADGFVIDMALHTVKVQNWDKTVTTIPTYKLFSESYRNWRQMFESGGRRIKRTLRIDANSVRFLTEDEVAALGRYRLLNDYLEQKRQDVQRTNQELGDAAQVSANRRRLTNLGTFRAYALAYLRSLDTLHQDMIMMVRTMQPEAEGIPVELYCFTNTTAWVDYERIQGDIFDHLLAILPELELRLYQSPSGADLARIAVR